MHALKLLIFALIISIPGLAQGQPFIVGRVMGQFGNQLFIIAATTSLALDNGAIPVFPDLKRPAEPILQFPFHYEKLFFRLKVTMPRTSIRFSYNEPHFHYAPIPYVPNMEMRGWFQSEKYFINHKTEILELFAPTSEISSYLNSKYSDIINHPKTVSIHFRSYLHEDPQQKFWPTCDISYYEAAMMLFPEDTLFIVFSNRIGWCKENFAHIPRNIRFIEGENHLHDFYLMSMCKHNIICNSTFSWWAAYLNRNTDKIVIAPKLWFNPTCGADPKDVIPKDWIILDH